MTRLAAAIVFVMTATTASAQPATPATQPSTRLSPRTNVLFIAVDDLNSYVRAFGDPNAITPNIDALAKRGVAFQRAYCQYPLCNPSRVSLLTGRRPDRTKVWDLETNLRKTMPDAVTLPQLFRNNGYAVHRVGKIFHYGVPREIGTSGLDDGPSWDTVFNPRGIDKDREDELHVLTRGTGTTLGFSMSWLDQEGTDADQTDGKGTLEAIRLLEANRETPFFIAVGFYRPHTPFVAPKSYFERYPKEQVKLPPRLEGDLDDVPSIALTIAPPDYGLSESELIDCVRAYRASISFVDAQVGKLVDALDRLGLSDSTMIVFWSDHGFLMGEHRQWQKQLLFEQSCRVPLMIVPPAKSKLGGEGVSSTRTVELIDVYPTVADLCGLATPTSLDGESLRPLLANPDAPWERPALSQVTRVTSERMRVMGYSVRTERYRYTEWDDGRHGLELYDYDSDPNELTNLAKDPANAKLVADLRDRLVRMTPDKPAATPVRRRPATTSSTRSPAAVNP